MKICQKRTRCFLQQLGKHRIMKQDINVGKKKHTRKAMPEDRRKRKMKLSTKSRYALEGLLYIAIHSPTEAVRIKQIAECTKISVAYLEQIFFLLKKSNLLTTVRGSKGGYTLAKPSQEITVGMIIRSIETHIVPVAYCVSRQIWIQINDTINRIVDHLTLQDLADRYKAQNLTAKKGDSQ